MKFSAETILALSTIGSSVSSAEAYSGGGVRGGGNKPIANTRTRNLVVPPETTPEPFDFSSVAPATTVQESIERLNKRKQLVLEWFANTELPACTEPDASWDKGQNCRLKDKTDSRVFADWTVANILLGNDISAAEAILMAEDTVAWGVPGTGYNWNKPDDFCYRHGDYDFALIDFLHLAYTARVNPGHLSERAYRKLVTELLTVMGSGHNLRYRIRCGKPKYGYVYLDMPDTENHNLRIQVAQYLTNQLLLELPKNDTELTTMNVDFMDLDNELNGNNEWMLRYLNIFMEKWWYEYNSRPYQEYNVISLTLLCDHAKDERVKVAAQMVLDAISTWTAVQTNELRRFAPFRRQPEYFNDWDKTQGNYAWAGDGEAERMALLVGNYGYLEPLNWTLPEGDGQRHFILYAATSEYRMNNALLELAIEEEGSQPQYFLAKHRTVEMYYKEPMFLLSAGGVFEESQFGSADTKGEENGWALPTTLIPTNEASSNILDMIQFVGHQDPKLRENTCVGHNFACGLTPDIGNKMREEGGNCPTTTSGDWVFFDLRGEVGCSLDYGFMVAFYTKDCEANSTCAAASATSKYGLLEVWEPDTATATVSTFSQQVLAHNPVSFASSGLHLYTTMAKASIEFEVFPQLGQGLSSIVSVDDIYFGQDTSQWPLVQGSIVQADQGKWTIASPKKQEDGSQMTLILDMSNPLQPQRSQLTKSPILSCADPASNVTTPLTFDNSQLFPVKSLSKVGFVYSYSGDNSEALEVILVEWDGGNIAEISGWTDDHTSETPNNILDARTMLADEYLEKVVIGCGDEVDVLSYLSVTTSLGRFMEFGFFQNQTARYQTLVAPQGQQIIGFHGEEMDGVGIVGMGVIYQPLS